MGSAAPSEEVKIAVPQRYKDFVVQRQYRWFWYLLGGVLGGINAVYYLLCVVFHWTWRFHFQADVILPILGLFSYARDVRKPWHYELNARQIKLFVINPMYHLANLKELEWAKTEVVGIEQGEWQGLPCLKLRILPTSSYIYTLVYSHADEEEVRVKVLPLIEKYRHQYHQKIWADKLRS